MQSRNDVRQRRWGMDEHFEAIAWWLNQPTTRVRNINMDQLSKGLEKYNGHLKAVAEPTDLSDKAEKVRPVSYGRATLYRRFSTVDNAMERTKKYLLAQGKPIPKVLQDFLAFERKTRTSASENSRRINGDATLNAITQSIKRARADHDDAQLVTHLEQLAARLLEEASADRVDEYLGRAFDAASEGYAIASQASKQGKRLRTDQMLCARSAAWAAVQQSRRSIGSPASDGYLGLSAIWKRNEAELAERLRLPLTAEVARFHADRAEALLADNLNRSIAGLSHISNYLIDRNGGHDRDDLNDCVRYHDLTSIIQRLCALDWAFPKNHENAKLIQAYFTGTGGIESVIKKLLELYNPEGRGPEARRDVEALLAIKEMNDALLAVYDEAEKNPAAPSAIAVNGERIDHLPTPESLLNIISEMTPPLFMRISEQKALHALAFARFAIAAHDIEVQTKHGKSNLPKAEQLLTTATNWCKLAEKSTRPKTVDRAILERIEKAKDRISKRISQERRREINQERKNAAPPQDDSLTDARTTGHIEGSFAHEAVHVLNNLLWKSMTSWPLNNTEAEDFVRIARDVERYLTGSRNTSQSKGINSELA